MEILGYIKGVGVFIVNSLIFWSKSPRQSSVFLSFISIITHPPICNLKFQQLLENQRHKARKKTHVNKYGTTLHEEYSTFTTI